MRGAETSDTMLPCERGIHLHKSANFKIIFEKLQRNHKNDLLCHVSLGIASYVLVKMYLKRIQKSISFQIINRLICFISIHYIDHTIYYGIIKTEPKEDHNIMNIM